MGPSRYNMPSPAAVPLVANATMSGENRDGWITMCNVRHRASTRRQAERAIARLSEELKARSGLRIPAFFFPFPSIPYANSGS